MAGATAAHGRGRAIIQGIAGVVVVLGLVAGGIQPSMAQALQEPTGGIGIVAVSSRGDAEAIGLDPTPPDFNAPDHWAVDVALSPSGRGLLAVRETGALRATGDAPRLRRPGPPTSGVVAVAISPSAAGAWVTFRSGHVEHLGDASAMGEAPVSAVPVVDSVPTPSGQGMWLARRDGSVAAVGDAKPLGDVPTSASPVTGIASTPTGQGVWLVRADGSVAGLGDAQSPRGPRGGRGPRVIDIASMGSTDRWAILDEAGLVEVTGEPRVPVLQPSAGAIAIDTTAAAGPVLPSSPEVPDTTKILRSGAVLEAAGDPSGPVDMVVPSAAVTGPNPIEAGDVVVTGVGASTPQGLLRRVDAITGNGDGTATLSTSPATITEALPTGEFDATDSLSDVQFGESDPVPLDDDGRVEPHDPLPALASHRSSRGPEPVAQSPLQAAMATPGSPLQVGTHAGVPLGTMQDGGLYDYECGPSDDNEVKATPAYSLDPELIFKAKWSGDVHVELGARVTGNLQIDFEATGAVECSAKYAIIRDRSLGTKVVFIGLFPVVITPRLTIEAELKGSLEGEMTATAGIVTTVEGKVVIDKPNGGPLSVVPSGSVGAAASPTPKLEADASLEVGFEVTAPQLVFVLWGLVGPEAALVPGISAKLTPCDTPNLTVTASMQGKFSLKPVGWLSTKLGDPDGLSSDLELPGSPTTLATVNSVPLPTSPCTEVQPPTLPPGEVDAAYDQQLTLLDQLGAPLPADFTVSDGALPPGLALATDGTISGTPTQAGAFSFTVTATSSAGTATRAYTLTVTDVSVIILTDTLPTGVVDAPYTAVLAANRPAGDLVWSITGGALPAGLTFDPSGTISGTPTLAGVEVVTVRAFDVPSGKSAEKVLPLTVLGGSRTPLGTGGRSLLDGFDVSPDGGVVAALHDGATVHVRSFSAGGDPELDIDVSDMCVPLLPSIPECTVDRHPDGSVVVAGMRPKGVDFELVVRRFAVDGTLAWEHTELPSLPHDSDPNFADYTALEPAGATFAADGSVAVFGSWGGTRALDCDTLVITRAVFGRVIIEFTPTGGLRRHDVPPLTYPKCADPHSSGDVVYTMAARADGTFVGVGLQNADTFGGTFERTTTYYEGGSRSDLFHSVSPCTSTCVVTPYANSIAVAGGRVYAAFSCTAALAEVTGGSVRTVEGGGSCDSGLNAFYAGTNYVVEGEASFSDSLVTVRYQNPTLPFPVWFSAVPGGTVERRADDGSVLQHFGSPIERTPGGYVYAAYPGLAGQVHAIVYPGGNPGFGPGAVERRSFTDLLGDP